MASEEQSDTASFESREGATESTDDGAETGVRLTRRRFLRTGGNVGVSAALVWGFGAEYASSDDLGTITYALARSDPDADSLVPRTREVPVPWHESLRLAFAVQDAVRSGGLSALHGSFVVPGNYDEPEASISVTVADESVVDRIEDLAEGVPVDTTVVEELPPPPDADVELGDAYQVAELELDRIPGGVLCQSGRMNGTLAPALYDVDRGSRFFATSNHVFGEGGSLETEHRGEALAIVHGDEPHRIGTVQRGYPTADLVQIVPVEGFRPAPVIERATPSSVIGQYTKMGLADLMARGEQLTKVGSMTGRTAGTIAGVDGVTCYTGAVCKPGQLKWGDEETIADGDSGSVNFRPDPENPEEYVLVGGINNARTWWPGADFTWGTSAHHLLDEYGLHF